MRTSTLPRPRPPKPRHRAPSPRCTNMAPALPPALAPFFSSSTLRGRPRVFSGLHRLPAVHPLFCPPCINRPWFYWPQLSSETPITTGESRGENQQEPRAALAHLRTSSAANVGHRQGRRETPAPRHPGLSAPGSGSSMSSMMQPSPVPILSRRGRASRHSLTASRATACARSSSRTPAASRAS